MDASEKTAELNRFCYRGNHAKFNNNKTKVTGLQE